MPESCSSPATEVPSATSRHAAQSSEPTLFSSSPFRVDRRILCHTVLTSARASFPLSGRRWKTRSYGVVMFRLVEVQA